MPYYAPALSFTGVGNILEQENIRRALGQTGLTPSQLDRYARAAINEMYIPYQNRMMSEEKLAEERRQFDIKQQLAEDVLKQQQGAGLLGAITNIGTTLGGGYLMYKALKPKEPTTPTPSISTALSPGISIAQSTPEYISYTIQPGAIERAYGLTGETTGAGAGAQAGTQATQSTWSALTSSPYFAPAAAGGLRAIGGLVSGERPERALARGAGTAAGTYAGAQIGTAIFPGVGTVIGSIIGSVVTDLVGDSCIIVTAIHGRDSEQVDIARRFRDTFLDSPTLRGYYFLAEQIVPFMKLYPDFKHYVKTLLVDKLIQFGRAVFDKQPVSDEAISTTLSFLSTCRQIGLGIPQYKRMNGEVI